MRFHTRIMTVLLLIAAVVAVMALSCFAAPFYSGKVFAGVLPEYDNSRLHTRGYYNSLPDMPVLAPQASFVNNKVLLTGSKARALVTAAYAARHRQGSGGPGSHRIELRKNRLILFGGYIEGSVHGAFGEGGAFAIGNTLTLDDEHAYVSAADTGSFDAAVTGAVGIEARQNSVLMHTGTVRGNVAGGHGQFFASDNTVLMHGGTVSGSVYGGGTHSGASFGNTVIMTGGAVEGQLVGGHSSHYGIASGNTVIFSGGSVGGISGSLTFENTADDNTVIINGGRIAPGPGRIRTEKNPTAVIYGGHSFRHGATNNHIYLGGKPGLENCLFYGGYADLLPMGVGGENADVTSGNHLILEEDYEGELPEARNFESVFVTGQGTVLPEKGYAFHASVPRLNNYGTVRFSGLAPASLMFAQTEYAGPEGGFTLYYHARNKLADKILLDKGALLITPISLSLKNPEDLPYNLPVVVVEIEHASSMRHVNRRNAVRLRQPEGDVLRAGQDYVLSLKLLLGGADKDVWQIIKREK